MDFSQPFVSLDFDKITALGGPADGLQFVVKKQANELTISYVHPIGAGPIRETVEYPKFVRLVYRRATGTRIFVQKG